MILIGSPDEIRALVAYPPEQKPILIRAQESGPCVYYDPDGTAPKDGDGPDYRKDPPRCTYPYPREGGCPHLDSPAILCPVKDACYAMRDVARMQETCEAEQTEQDADMTAEEPVYAPAEPEFVEPAGSSSLKRITRMQEWTAEEDAAIRDATTAAESVPLYRSAVPDSGRSDAAIRAQWYIKVRPGLCEARDSLPDFDGDVVPVTQCEEPVFLPGDRVRLVDNPDMVGEVVYVAANGRYVSVQFPGPGPAKVCAIDSIEGAGA